MNSSLAYAIWAVLAVALLVLWVASRTAGTAGNAGDAGAADTTNRARPIARPSVVLTRLAKDPWLRVPLLVGWAWVGWHLFAR